MYVEPNSTVYLMKNVPLDPTYQHTVLFSSKAAQEQSFMQFTSAELTFENLSYQRHGRGYLKIAKNVGKLLNCNYMMFRNYDSETMNYDRWFYAFVTDVEYINENTTMVRYEIDIMQTWLFDYQLDPVFVEREHSSTDVPGDNLIDDKLERGEYVFKDYAPTGILNNYGILIFSTYDPNTGADVVGGNFGKLYSAAKPFFFDTPESANSFIESCTTAGKAPQCIVGVSMCPTLYKVTVDSQGTQPASATISYSKNYTNIDGYVPKNKKLFTQPYNFLYVTNLCGSTLELGYEYFSTANCKLVVAGTPSLSMDITLSPDSYKGAGRIDETQPWTGNTNEMISLSDFPLCCYSVDAFNAWFAQNKGSYISGKVNQVVGAIGQFAMGNIAGGAISLVSGVSSTIGELRDKSVQPPNVTGTPAASSIFGCNCMDFWVGHVTIKAQFAKIIDEYWSKFGYPCHQIKVPNRNARANWNYVKTQGCEFTGSIPASDAEAIKAIYDNGVTFWNDINNVGKYGDFTNPINA